jgi:peptidoglycan-associated lipoprotein
MLHQHQRVAGLVCAGVLATVLAGCAVDKRVQAPIPPATTSGTTVTVTSATIPEKPKPVSPSLAVSERILQACKLRFESVPDAPKFDFDKSDLLSSDYEVLGKIAHCLSTGPLQGKVIQLVGRADPRGTQDYNMALGARRAHTVADFLRQLGVAPDRMHETSRGEIDATGTEEASWQVDRRVDIVLVE